MESIRCATLWWCLLIYDQVSNASYFAVLGDAEVNDEDLETIFTG